MSMQLRRHARHSAILLQVLNDKHESIAGVNLDEEAANMVKFQQLYAASSKLIQTGNQMFETLLSMVSR